MRDFTTIPKVRVVRIEETGLKWSKSVIYSFSTPHLQIALDLKGRI